MSIVRVEITIRASREICFDLARSVDAHIHTTSATKEQAVGGVTSGLLSLGDFVTWRARHLGVTQELTSRITVFDRPAHFRDEMIRGVFHRLVHDHYFEDVSNGTCMIDVLDLAAPLGLLGRMAETMFLTSYMRRFLETRARALKDLAETGEGMRFLEAG